MLACIAAGARAEGPMLDEGQTRLDVGVAIDAVIFERWESWRVTGEGGVLVRSLPVGAVLLDASIAACGKVTTARVEAAKKVAVPDIDAGAVAFPVPACAVGQQLEMKWAWVLRAPLVDGHFRFEVEAADRIALDIDGGGAIWKMTSSSHLLMPKYRGDTGAAVEVRSRGAVPPSRFDFAWRLSGLDEHGFVGIRWGAEPAERGVRWGVVPAAAVEGRTPLALTVALDRRLGDAAIARITTWFGQVLARAGRDDRFNTIVYDGASPSRKPLKPNHVARWAAEAVGLEQARTHDVAAWFRATRGASAGLSWASAVAMAHAETTPVGWRRVMVSFGATGPLAHDGLDAVFDKGHPLRLLVIGPEMVSRTEPPWIERVAWESAWDRASSPRPGRWPAVAVRPDVARLVCGRRGQSRDLGDLWPDRPVLHRYWTSGGKGGGKGQPACIDDPVPIEGEVGDAWLVREIALMPLTPGGITERAAKALARVEAAADPRVANDLRKRAGLALGEHVLAWPGTGAGRARQPALAVVGIAMDVEPGDDPFGTVVPTAVRASDARRAFRVRTIASRVGGRSGTQLRDRLERHRESLERALGAALPGGRKRLRQLEVQLVVDATGVPRNVVFQPPVEASSATEALTGFFLKLAFDPLPRGDGGDTLFTVQLDLR
jgi:hypothetical protein